MVELMILGFLAEGPLHGYELRRRMERLHGFARTVSDGTLYPAVRRLATAGWLRREPEPGSGGPERSTLHLTDAGHSRLLNLLRDASGHDITDGHRFMVVLAFLSLLTEPAERCAVLRRRLDFLSCPESFFTDGDRQLRLADIDDPYRRGILLTARAASSAERMWIEGQLGEECA